MLYVKGCGATEHSKITEVYHMTVAGGTSRRVKAGDVVIIPPNTAHWWSSLEGKIVYLVVRVDPEKVVQLK